MSYDQPWSVPKNVVMDAREQDVLAKAGQLVALLYLEGSNQTYPYRVSLDPDELRELRGIAGGQLTIQWYIKLTKVSRAKPLSDLLKEWGWNRRKPVVAEEPDDVFAEVLCDGSHEFHSCGKSCADCLCGFETLMECQQYELSKERVRLQLSQR